MARRAAPEAGTSLTVISGRWPPPRHHRKSRVGERGRRGRVWIAAIVSTAARPQTPEYLEWRLGRQSTVLFPNGLPFHRRHETRMLDVILVTEHETARATAEFPAGGTAVSQR